jgi:hypothetical protein
LTGEEAAMGGERVPGAEGLDEEPVEDDGALTRGGFSQPGPIGLKGGGPRVAERKVGLAYVTPTSPSPVSADREISGASTIAEVGRLLNTYPEWGQGGGRITAGRIDAGTSPTADVTLTVTLELTMPVWLDRDKASDKAKAEWDRMYRALRDHEEVHLQNVIDVAKDLAATLPGRNINDVKGMVEATSEKIKAKHSAWDTQTNHGKNTGVTLDPNII